MTFHKLYSYCFFHEGFMELKINGILSTLLLDIFDQNNI